MSDPRDEARKRALGCISDVDQLLAKMDDFHDDRGRAEAYTEALMLIRECLDDPGKVRFLIQAIAALAEKRIQEDNE